MRLNKASQYGLLFSLYLSRAGRARVEDVAANLNISCEFLYQIARKLKVGGVVISVRGPGGGYELRSGATVLNVLDSLGVAQLLGAEETVALQRGATEHRALANFVGALSFSIGNLLSTQIAHVSEALVAQEVEQLSALSDNAIAN